MPHIVYPLTFDNNDLGLLVPGLTVLAVNSYLMPKRKLITNDIIRSDQSKVSTGYYTDKEVVVTVGITQPTRSGAENSLDTLMGYIQGLEKNLVVYEGGQQRRYVATYADSILRHGGGSYIELDLVFVCSDRFGYSLQYEKLLDATGRTLYNYTDSFTVGGNAPTQVPVIAAFLSALSGSTTNVVSIGNVDTGRFITISRAWTAGDRLVIDCQNKTVKVNGTDVDFTGAFPEFAPGVGYLNYQDNFSSRTLALSAYYYRRYV